MTTANASSKLAAPATPRLDSCSEASLRAADLVICQTGCLSHDAYWRVQDHCRRTGKPCVMVGEPQPIHFVRRETAEEAAVERALPAG